MPGSPTDNPNTQPFMVGMTIVWTLAIALLLPTVISISLRDKKCGRSQMPPRAQLRRLWLVVRGFIGVIGIAMLYTPVSYIITEGWTALIQTKPISTGMLIAGPISFLASLVLTPAFRGAFHRWLGALGKSDSQQQEAASIAALIGGSGQTAATALTLARQNFRGVPVKSLTIEELMDNKPSQLLFDKTIPARLGDVAAFVSHSWSDPGAAKHDHLQKFASSINEEHVQVWLDKACMCAGLPFTRPRLLATSLSLSPLLSAMLQQ